MVYCIVLYYFGCALFHTKIWKPPSADILLINHKKKRQTIAYVSDFCEIDCVLNPKSMSDRVSNLLYCPTNIVNNSAVVISWGFLMIISCSCVPSHWGGIKLYIIGKWVNQDKCKFIIWTTLSPKSEWFKECYEIGCDWDSVYKYLSHILLDLVCAYSITW